MPSRQADRLLWWPSPPSACLKVCSDRLKRRKEEVSCDAVGLPQSVCPIYTCDPFRGGSFVEWPIVIDRYSSHPGGRAGATHTIRYVRGGRSTGIVFFCVNALNQRYSLGSMDAAFHRKRITIPPSKPKALMWGIIVLSESVTCWPNFDVEILTLCYRQTLKPTDGAVKHYKMIPCSTLFECSQLICRRR